MNYFLEMFGYRERITYDEYRNWKRQGHKVNKESLPTDLLPANVEVQAVIERVLLRNTPNGFSGWRLPTDELIISWQMLCPQENFIKLDTKATAVFISLVTAENKRQKEQQEKPRDGRHSN